MASSRPEGQGWFPVAASDDAVAHHVVEAVLAERELAVWRDDDGWVNVWENRCLHRGVRLSIGHNEGMELVCQYHGWRYASRTAGCTYIPAHPADAPARTMCNRTYPAIERYGLIWTTLADATGSDGPPSSAPLESGSTLPLRAMAVNVPAGRALDSLAGLDLPDPNSPDGTTGGPHRRIDGFTLVAGSGEGVVVFFAQPVAAERCVVRGVVGPAPDEGATLALLRRFNRFLTEWRDEVEAQAEFRPGKRATPPPPTPAIAACSDGTRTRVRVSRRWLTARDVVAVELEAVDGVLPTVQPGAHIDVHLPGGLVRQYSLVNEPGRQDVYLIGVKLEPESRGGSRWIHQSLSVGDVLTIGGPHNNFALRRDAQLTLLIAGGIGITPLLSMARSLHRSGIDFRLHHFARSPEHLAFTDLLAGLGEHHRPHLGLDPAATTVELESILAEPGAGHQVYICGPGPMADAARRVAAEKGWPEESVHFEYFANTRPRDDRHPFTVELARSALTLEVPAGRSILEVVRENGVQLESSCEQGACGTCTVGVIEGVVDHQDVHLSERERAEGRRVVTCVSRAAGDRLVLDL
ncbi:MAG TPA: 2Fe-2S iron-sulfur cluster binding domain-containing protein [Acidimicrobiales bacterium]|nr:2Fe-2S iron-sulfur cluster binding domain-containing protein [Acidimicrobiales bacterium]